MNNITIDYSVFDNDENLKVFHKLYQKEIELQPTIQSNIGYNNTQQRENFVEFEVFKEKLNKHKTPNPYIITGNNNNNSNYYYYNVVIRNKEDENSNILYKYFQYYSNFFNFNLHNSSNPNSVVYNFYNVYSNYNENFAFHTLSYNMYFLDKNFWRGHYTTVKNTKEFVGKYKLNCSEYIKNMFEDLEILNGIVEKIDLLKLRTIEDIENFEKNLEEECKKLKNYTLSNYVIQGIKNNNTYIEIKIVTQRNEILELKKIEKELKNYNQKMIEVMGIFLTIFSIITINFEAIKNDINIGDSILVTFIIVTSMNFLFKLIRGNEKTDKK